jgi:hypothetical protein
MKTCECEQCADCMQGNNNMPGFGGTLRNSGQSIENPNANKIQFTPVTFDTPDQMKDFIREIIRKVKGGHRLYSSKGKNLGTFDTLAGAKNHEREVNYFKHKK